MTYSRVRLSGVVTYRRIVAAQQALSARSGFDPTLPLLIDLREAWELQLTTSEIQSLATKSPVAVGTPRAILVRDATVFGTARLVQISFVDFARSVTEQEYGLNADIFRSWQSA